MVSMMLGTIGCPRGIPLGYWFKADSPWKNLLNAWAQENRFRLEDLQLSTLAARNYKKNTVQNKTTSVLGWLLGREIVPSKHNDFSPLSKVFFSINTSTDGFVDFVFQIVFFPMI